MIGRSWGSSLGRPPFALTLELPTVSIGQRSNDFLMSNPVELALLTMAADLYWSRYRALKPSFHSGDLWTTPYIGAF
jgi:hypothetical protein